MSFVSSMIFMFSVGSSLAFQPRSVPSTRTMNGATASLRSMPSDYLSSLGGPNRDRRGGMPMREPPMPPPMPPHMAPPPMFFSPTEDVENVVHFSHAPASYFSIEKLKPKGSRKNADVGKPHDATRELVSVGPTSVGSWWCAEGGWQSPEPRTTTEVFYVLSGNGAVTDMDHVEHFFGPGDTVIMPKGWAGRWDIMKEIHKVWFVFDHPRVEETSDPIRAVVTPYCRLAPLHLLRPQGVRSDALHGAPITASQTAYGAGPIEVGCSVATPGSFPVPSLETVECMHVLEGLFFLTSADGTSRRCVAGDTVVLPKGWSGNIDVIESVRKLWGVMN